MCVKDACGGVMVDDDELRGERAGSGCRAGQG